MIAPAYGGEYFVGEVGKAPAHGRILTTGGVRIAPANSRMLMAGDVVTASPNHSTQVACGVLAAPAHGRIIITGGVVMASANRSTQVAGGVVMTPAHSRIHGISRVTIPVAGLVVVASSYGAEIVRYAIRKSTVSPTSYGGALHTGGDPVAVETAQQVRAGVCTRHPGSSQTPGTRELHPQGLASHSP